MAIFVLKHDFSFFSNFTLLLISWKYPIEWLLDFFLPQLRDVHYFDGPLHYSIIKKLKCSGIVNPMVANCPLNPFWVTPKIIIEPSTPSKLRFWCLSGGSRKVGPVRPMPRDCLIFLKEAQIFPTVFFVEHNCSLGLKLNRLVIRTE